MDAQLRQLMGQFGGGGSAPQPGGDHPTNDNAETIHISSLALLKVCNLTLYHLTLLHSLTPDLGSSKEDMVGNRSFADDTTYFLHHLSNR